ncbi:hypothetical protein BDP27DRAFT_1409390 [Rhodocollybia butyracea]|uniref:Uncharacterized protein n=1 Tax=Rhodocollybia butyracea TaxID=206335 RepID=A0A9P5P2Z6_9AGAR|nr:hypothetical protein BDP27DRAFT_1409390 [Rhodocollybia butyracea]
MSHSSNALVSPAVQTLLKQNIIETALSMGVWGLNTSLAILAVYTLIKQGLRASKSRQWLLFVLCLMYFGTCVTQLLYILKALKLIMEMKNVGGPSLPIIITGKQFFILDTFTRLNYLLSDGIVCWRAWSLYPRNRLAKGVLVLCMLGGLAACITSFAFGAEQVLKHKTPSNLSVTAISNIWFYLPLLFTNIVATLLVGVKFWNYRAAIMAHLFDGKGQKTPVSRILILLTESGIIYCFFWVLSILSSASIMGSFAAQMFECVLPMLPGMYLSVIILVVSLQKSLDMNSIFLETIEVEDYMNFAEPAFDSDLSTTIQRSEKNLRSTGPQIGESFAERVRGVSRWNTVDLEGVHKDSDTESY